MIFLYIYRQQSMGWHRIHPHFAMCGMNLGFIREVAPVMYQPAQGPAFPFTRLEDIWQGLLCQKVLTLHDYAFANGGAVLQHQRASDSAKNVAVEAAGKPVHELFWQWVWEFEDKRVDITNTYLALADHVAKFNTDNVNYNAYFKLLARNMKAWVEMTYA